VIAAPQHGEIVAVDRSRLLPADRHFNPALGVHDGTAWMVYRRVSGDGGDVVEWPRRLAACRLGGDLQPIAGSNVDLSSLVVDPPGSRPWHADARLSATARGLWMTYHDNHALFGVPVVLGTSGELRPKPLVLHGREPRARERNWGVFEDRAMKAVYTIDPHVVVSLTEGDRAIDARPLHETPARLPWDAVRLGEPHGGSPPVRVGESWFAFFQSSSPDAPGSERKIYRVGFYGFDAEPPHAISHMTPEPLLSGTDFDPPYSFFLDYAVAYPSGALHLDGRWLVGLGIHDRTLALAGFDHDRLLAACERV